MVDLSQNVAVNNCCYPYLLIVIRDCMQSSSSQNCFKHEGLIQGQISVYFFAKIVLKHCRWSFWSWDWMQKFDIVQIIRSSILRLHWKCDNLRLIHITAFSACVCGRRLRCSAEIEKFLSMHWRSPLRNPQTAAVSVNEPLRLIQTTERLTVCCNELEMVVWTSLNLKSEEYHN